MQIQFVRADIKDVDALIKVRNLCFYEDYIKYGECPGYNITYESMLNSVVNKIVYNIIADDQIIGNISIKDNQDNTYFLGCLCVIPEYENKGIGQRAINFIESEFPNATAWSLATPADKKKNHYFYKKVGYSIVKEYMEGKVKLVLFEKKMKCGI